MDPNPYESPNSIETLPQKSGRVAKLIGAYEIFLLIIPTVMLAAAIAHRLQLDNPDAYRRSPLILVEVIGLLLSFFIALFTFFLFITLVFTAYRTKSLVYLAISVFAFLAMIAAGQIDSPTLIYGT